MTSLNLGPDIFLSYPKCFFCFGANVKQTEVIWDKRMKTRRKKFLKDMCERWWNSSPEKKSLSKLRLMQEYWWESHAVPVGQVEGELWVATDLRYLHEVPDICSSPYSHSWTPEGWCLQGWDVTQQHRWHHCGGLLYKEERSHGILVMCEDAASGYVI